MAQRIEILLTDGISGDDIPTGKGETITFALGGHTYEIDLTNKNAGALRKALAPYIAVSRRVKTTRGARIKQVQVGADARTVKEWARANGYDVNDLGRVPKEIREAFEAAN